MKKISYKKLWKLLIDKEVKKKTLSEQSGISQSTMTKMSRGENVNVDILVRICNALDCEFCDIVDMVPIESTDE